MHKHKEPIHEIHIHANCFKCGHDHIHFEFANLVMTFNIEQFMTISEMFVKVRQEVLAASHTDRKVAELVM